MKKVFSMMANEFKSLLKNPIKLIPTIVLSIIWIALPIVMGMVQGANIPVIRFFASLFYVNGGILGGFFGTLGGIFGKAIFASVINGLVISICDKKNPFKGFKKGISSALGGGVNAIVPFLIGGGIGFILYFFFNITSAPQNSMIAIVCVIALLTTLSKQNGVIFYFIFFILRKLSKGKAPSRSTISKLILGLSMGFAASFPITFLRYRFLMLILGLIVLSCGICLYFIFRSSKNKLDKTIIESK